MNELAFIVQQTTPKSSGLKPQRLFLTIPWVIWTILAGAEWSRIASSLIGASAGIGGWWRLSLYGFSIYDGQPRLVHRVEEGFPVLGQKLQGHLQFGLRFRKCTISLTSPSKQVIRPVQMQGWGNTLHFLIEEAAKNFWLFCCCCKCTTMGVCMNWWG